MSRKPPRPRNRIVRAAVIGAADGVAAGWILLLILLRLDIGGTGTLVRHSPDGPIALLTLLVGFGVTFSLVGLGWRIMVVLPRED